VFVQPILGRKNKFNTVAEALQGLHSKECVVPTDIVATAWPISWVQMLRPSRQADGPGTNL
jgi:hypothetical protein